MATIIKGSTKKGQGFISQFERSDGFFLHEVYNTHSIAKQDAWSYCFEKYLNTPNHEHFHITSHNCMFFTVAWSGTYENEDALYFETAYNSYIILLDK